MNKPTLTLSVALGLSAALTAGPAWAVHPLEHFTVFGRHGVMIGVGSRVLESTPGQLNGDVGACGPSSLPVNVNALCIDDGQAASVPPGDALVMNGGALIEGMARIFGNSRLADGPSQIQADLISMGTINGQANPNPQDPDVGDDTSPPAARALRTLANAFLQPLGFPLIEDPDTPGPIANLLCPSLGMSFSRANNGPPVVLTPGQYGDITAGAGLKLILDGPGLYVINSIGAGQGAKIQVNNIGTRVIVCDQASFGSVSVFPADLEHTDFTFLVGSSDQENAFSALGSSHWRGDVFSRGGIHIGSGGSQSSVFGRLLAGGKVDIEHGVVVQATGTTHGSPSKDATLLHSAKNENNGANNILLVKSQVAAVVGFDIHDRDLSHVTSAQLVLTVCNMPDNPDFCPKNAPDNRIIKDFTPRQWPVNGAPVTAYQLADGFEDWGSGIPGTSTPPEGNGNNFPKKDSPHGDGAGATWNCSIDSDVSNEAMDCDAAHVWGGGINHQGPGTASDQPIQNDMANGTQITFDVTADVQAGLGPLDATFMTWFIRTNNGVVSFYSLQGAQALAPGVQDPPFAPKLIITP